MSRIKFKQPNNRLVTVDIYGESMSCYSDEEYEKDSTLRGIMKADIFVEVGSYGDVFHRSYSINDKTLIRDRRNLSFIGKCETSRKNMKIGPRIQKEGILYL